MRKPPKPPHVVPSPRFRVCGGSKKTSLDTCLTAVRTLAKREAEIEHFEEFYEQVELQKNDRGAAILAATNVEISLRFAITKRLLIPKKDFDRLFGQNGPLGTFYNKILLGTALEIFKQEMRTNLDVIRSVRNAFAHAQIPIKFSTQEIMEACAFLVLPKPLHPFAVEAHADLSTPRKAFQSVCNCVGHNLFMYGIYLNPPPQRRDGDTFIEYPEEMYDTIKRPKSLP